MTQRVPNRFGRLTVTEQTRLERHRLQTHLAYGAAVLGAAGVLIALVASAILTLTGHPDRIEPFFKDIGPYILPVVGGVVAFAFGRHHDAS
jgi:hypothetical protein